MTSQMSKRKDAGGKIRTTELATKHKNKKNTPYEKDYDYQKDIVTTSQYCFCKYCVKYCNNRQPIQCIDPFFMDMKHTYWIYHGLVMASKTERAISIHDNTNEKYQGKEENE